MYRTHVSACKPRRFVTREEARRRVLPPTLPRPAVFPLAAFAQGVNAGRPPCTLFCVGRRAASRKVRGDYANGRIFNILAGATVIATSTLSLLLLGVTFAGR